VKTKITTALIFLCAGFSAAWLLLSFPPDIRAHLAVLIVSALALIVASGLVFLRQPFSCWLGLASGIVALHWFSRFEFGYEFPALNSWLAFNLPDGNPLLFQDVLWAKLKIFFFASVVVSTVCSATRLLPAGWKLRKVPLEERTWPAFVVCFVVVVAWYGVSVTPYRIPLIVDRAWPELTILHVEKAGVQYHETAIRVYRDGKCFVQRNDRKLFQYRFSTRGGTYALPITLTAKAIDLARSDLLKDMHTLPAVALRSRNAEGWYVRIIHPPALAFTTEYGTQPPIEVVNLFHELESATPAGEKLGNMNDVCMGFCYDPLAGLGVEYINERCTDRNGTYCK
jgi:hypothetical protein